MKTAGSHDGLLESPKGRALPNTPAWREWTERSAAARWINANNLRHWKALLPALVKAGFGPAKVDILIAHGKVRRDAYEDRTSGQGVVDAALSAAVDAEAKLAELSRCCSGAWTNADGDGLRVLWGLLNYDRLCVEPTLAALRRFRLRSRKLSLQCHVLLTAPANRKRGRPRGGPLRATAEVWQALGLPNRPILGARFRRSCSTARSIVTSSRANCAKNCVRMFPISIRRPMRALTS